MRLEAKEHKDGKDNLEKVLRFVALKTTSVFWTEHLDSLEHLKDSVRLRAYGGKDPIIEYKTEGHKMFQTLQDRIDSQITRTIFKLSVTNPTE